MVLGDAKKGTRGSGRKRGIKGDDGGEHRYEEQGRRGERCVKNGGAIGSDQMNL